VTGQERDSCVFCSCADIVGQNSFAFATADRFPVVRGHLLVCPRRHVASFFELTLPELDACFELLKSMRARAREQDASVTGFNLGVNDGADAGQTVIHCHIHLIPRRRGDVQNPVGGVRNVIAGKGDYTAAADPGVHSLTREKP
jgi:ATP adenylyltransferase